MTMTDTRTHEQQEAALLEIVRRLLPLLSDRNWDPLDEGLDTFVLQVDMSATDDEGRRCYRLIEVRTDGSVTESFDHDGGSPGDCCILVMYPNLIWRGHRETEAIRACLAEIKAVLPEAVLNIEL